MSDCTHNCSTCGESCSERTAESLLAQANPGSHVKKVIAVVSGKGGVGKSTVTSLLAIAMQRKGYKVGILDADITGPSIPRAFQVHEHPTVEKETLYPVQQFWTDVAWGDVDYLFVDMPPGTGDVPLTVFQSLPIDGAIVVTSPQDLVSMIVEKAVKMLGAMDIPVLGFVENYGFPVLSQLPIDPAVAEAADQGQIETLDTAVLEEAVKVL